MGDAAPVLEGVSIHEVRHVPGGQGVLTEIFRAEWETSPQPVVFLYAQRPVVPQPEEAGGLALERLIAQYRVAYVLVGPAQEWSLDGARRYSPPRRSCRCSRAVAERAG